MATRCSQKYWMFLPNVRRKPLEKLCIHFCVNIIVLALLISNVMAQNKANPQEATNYSWSDIRRGDLKSVRIYLGNYQDYWIDWSPDGNRLLGLATGAEFGIHVIDLSNVIFR